MSCKNRDGISFPVGKKSPVYGQPFNYRRRSTMGIAYAILPVSCPFNAWRHQLSLPPPSIARDKPVMSSPNPFTPNIPPAILFCDHAAYVGDAAGDILYGWYFACTIIDRKTALRVLNRGGHHSLLRMCGCHSETPTRTAGR